MSTTPTTGPTTTWSWRPTITDRMRARVRWTAIGGAAAIAGAVAVAAFSTSRFTIVVAAMIIGIVVLWWLEHRRFLGTRVAILADGTLTATDGRTAKSLPMSGIDTVTVRQRQSSTRYGAAWTFEAAGDAGALHVRFPRAAGLIDAEAADVERMAQTVRSQLGSAATPTPPPPSAANTFGLDDLPPPPPAGAPTSERFVWTPPISPNARRHRLMLRVGYLGLALAIAVYAGISERDAGAVGILLSITVVPGMILLFGAGLDYALGVARTFRLEVAQGTLHIGSSLRRTVDVPILGADVVVDTQAHHAHAGGTTQRHVRWFLTVTAPDGATTVRQFPSFGVVTTPDDYVALERELRRRA